MQPALHACSFSFFVKKKNKGGKKKKKEKGSIRMHMLCLLCKKKPKKKHESVTHYPRPLPKGPSLSLSLHTLHNPTTVRLPIIQQPPDLLERNGLRHEEVDAAGEGFALVSAGGEAREGDDEGWWRGRGGGVVLTGVVGASRVVRCVGAGAAGFFNVADGAGGFEAV